MMICRNCGTEVNEGYEACPFCGGSLVQNVINNGQNNEIKTTGLLVFSIIELVCLSPIFGLIALILYFAQLKPAISRGDIVGAKKSKKSIFTLLIVGIILNVVMSFVVIVLILIPNFSGIQSRSQISTDRATAAQVGKAVRIWYTEAQFGGMYEYKSVEDGFVRIDKIDGLEDYVAPDVSPLSYGMKNEEGAFYATIIGEDNGFSKVVVAIGPENLYNSGTDSNVGETFYQDIEDGASVTYTGVESGIAYVE